jgi:hypothetical protein
MDGQPEDFFDCNHAGGFVGGFGALVSLQRCVAASDQHLPTIITFLMVFLIQNTKNRDTDIMHIKIDELLRVTKDAQNAVLSLDNLDQKELAALRKRYKALGADEVNDPDSTPGDSSNQSTAN